jgi:hypothetical protein
MTRTGRAMNARWTDGSGACPAIATNVEAGHVDDRGRRPPSRRFPAVSPLTVQLRPEVLPMRRYRLIPAAITCEDPV